MKRLTRQGAKACLVIHNTAAASYPFSVVQSSNGGVKLHLDTGAIPVPAGHSGWVTEETGKKMLAAAGKDGSLLEQARHHGFKPQSLDIRISRPLKVKQVYNSP